MDAFTFTKVVKMGDALMDQMVELKRKIAIFKIIKNGVI